MELNLSQELESAGHWSDGTEYHADWFVRNKDVTIGRDGCLSRAIWLCACVRCYNLQSQEQASFFVSWSLLKKLNHQHHRNHHHNHYHRRRHHHHHHHHLLTNVSSLATSTHALLPIFPEESWKGKFLNPERKRCGLKNIHIRVDRAAA